MLNSRRRLDDYLQSSELMPGMPTSNVVPWRAFDSRLGQGMT